MDRRPLARPLRRGRSAAQAPDVVIAGLVEDLGDSWEARALAYSDSGLAQAAFDEDPGEVQRALAHHGADSDAAAAVGHWARAAWALTRALWRFDASPVFVDGIGRVLRRPERCGDPGDYRRWHLAISELCAAACRSRRAPEGGVLLRQGLDAELRVDEILAALVAFCDATLAETAVLIAGGAAGGGDRDGQESDAEAAQVDPELVAAVGARLEQLLWGRAGAISTRRR